jgi:hypothetical protein
MDDELRRQTESIERGAPVESRAEEDREEAAPGDDEATSDERIRGGRREGLDAIEARSELARYLQPSAFPADRDGLLTSAGETRAPEQIRRALEALPASKLYDNVQSVWEDVGGGGEERA